MPDFGLTEALEQALKASGKTSVMPAAEEALASGAAKTGPGLKVPAVTAPDAPVARMPSVQAPSATPPPGSVQAPPLDPSAPPADIPPQQAAAANAPPTAAVAPTDVAATGTEGAPPAPTAAEPPVAPPATPVDTTKVAPANVLPKDPGAPPAPVSDVQASAQRFVTANIGDFGDKLNMSHMPNTDVMATPDGLKASILQVADDNKAAIDAARRGTVTDQQLIGLAQDIAANTDVVKQVLTREFGTTVQQPEVMLAARMVEQHQAGTVAALADKVASGTATAAEIVQYQQNEDIFARYLTQLMGAKAEWGRTGRGLQIPVGLQPEMEQHLAGLFQRNDLTMQQRAAAIKLAGTPAGIANIVHGSLPFRFMKAGFNALQRVFINGILWGPQTWFKIFTGNNFNLLMNVGDLYAAGIGRGMAGLAARIGGYPTAEEGVTLSDAYAHLHGVISGGADGLRMVGRVLKTGQSFDGIMRSEEDFGGQKILSGKNPLLPELQDTYFGAIAHTLGTMNDFSGRIIGSIDSFTRMLGYRGYRTMMGMKELRAKLSDGTLRPGDAEQFMRDYMQSDDEKLDEAATAWGSRMTFQTPFGETGKAMQNLINKAPALRFIFPFMRTATNIFKQSLIERTPLAVFSARIRSQITAGGFEGDLAKARIATGTAVGSMLAWMAIHDRITGDAPKDPKQRAEWELDGRMPYSVRYTDPITGKDSWHSYTWFEPMATIAGVVADSVQLHSYLAQDDNSLADHDTMLADARAHIMASIIQNVGNKTFMQGAAQFAEMYNDPQRAFGMWFDQVGASMQPFSGLTKFVRNEQDPYLRQAFTLLDKIRDQLPTVGGLKGSHTLPARLDVFGQPRKTTYGNSILGPMSPLPSSPVEKDDLTDEIQSVMEQTRTVPLTMPSKQLALLGNGRGLQDGQGMRLTPQEYNEYVQMARADPVKGFGGLTFREKLEQVIGTPTYQRSTPAERAVLLEQVQNQADRNGRQRLFDEDPDFRERMTQWTAEKNRLKFGQ